LQAPVKEGSAFRVAESSPPSMAMGAMTEPRRAVGCQLRGMIVAAAYSLGCGSRPR
jgi:hypothetical protein